MNSCGTNLTLTECEEGPPPHARGSSHVPEILYQHWACIAGELACIFLTLKSQKHLPLTNMPNPEFWFLLSKPESLFWVGNAHVKKKRSQNIQGQSRQAVYLLCDVFSCMSQEQEVPTPSRHVHVCHTCVPAFPLLNRVIIATSVSSFTILAQATFTYVHVLCNNHHTARHPNIEASTPIQGSNQREDMASRPGDEAMNAIRAASATAADELSRSESWTGTLVADIRCCSCCCCSSCCPRSCASWL